MRYYFIIILIINCLGQTASTQEAETANLLSASGEISLADLIETAFHDNPDILAARSNWEQTIERFPLETALDDPMLNFNYFVENVETRVGAQQFSIGIQQRFPFPGTLRQKGRVIEKEIDIAELKYEQTVRNIIADLKQAVFELKYIKGAIDVTQQNQKLLDEILLFAQTRYNDMQSSLNDVLRAESQLVQLDYDLITLRELLTVQLAVINSMLNRPKDTPIDSIYAPIPKPATPTLESLDELALVQNQEIQMAEMGVLKADEQIKLAHKENSPTFNLGASYIDTDEAINPLTPDSGKDPIGISAGVSIPLWFNKNKARVRIAEEKKESAEHEEDAVANTIQVNIRKTYFRLQNALRLMELYQNHLIPQAQHSMQIAEEWNREGKGSVSEILEVQSVWLNFNLAWLRAQVDYAQAYVQLERLVGGSLAPVVEGRLNNEN